MIRTAGFLLALLVAACTPQRMACTVTVEAPIAFVSGAREDRVSAHIEGPACDAAIGVLVIHDSHGTPLWAWAAPLFPTFGDAFAPAAKALGRDEAEAFATRWARVTLARTDAAPPWPVDAPSPLGAAHTRLDQATYEDLRARALPLACHLSGVARETCVVYEPAAAAAFAFVERDVAEATP